MQPPNPSSPSRPPARLREGRGPGTRRPWGQGGPVRPHSPLLLRVAGSSLSRRGHEEAAVDRPSRSATACRGSCAHCYPFRCRSRGCGEAEQRRGGTDDRREGRKERRREGGAGRAGKGGGDCGRGAGGTDPRGNSGHPGRPPACPVLCTEGRIAQPDPPLRRGGQTRQTRPAPARAGPLRKWGRGALRGSAPPPSPGSSGGPLPPARRPDPTGLLSRT